MQTDATDLGLPAAGIHIDGPPPVLWLHKLAEGVVVACRVGRGANVQHRVVRHVGQRGVDQRVAQLRQLVGRQIDPESFHASHFASDFIAFAGFGGNQVNAGLFLPLAVFHHVDRRSRRIRKLGRGDIFDRRPIPLHGAPNSFLGVADRGRGQQSQRVIRSGEPIQQNPHRHEIRLAATPAACETDIPIMATLVQHRFGPRMPNEVLGLVIPKYFSRTFEVLFAPQPIGRATALAVHKKLDGPIGILRRENESVAADRRRGDEFCVVNETGLKNHKSFVPKSLSQPGTGRFDNGARRWYSEGLRICAINFESRARCPIFKFVSHSTYSVKRKVTQHLL